METPNSSRSNSRSRSKGLSRSESRHRSLSRTQSQRSRPSTPPLHRLYSRGHIDDASHYHHKHDREHDSVDQASLSDGGEKSIGSNNSNEREEYEGADVPEPVDGIIDEVDLEKATVALEKKSSRKSIDPNLVTYDDQYPGPKNPKQWPMRQKWAATLMVSLFTLISPVSSSMVAPALTAMSKDLGVHSGVEQSLMLSIFVLAYAVGPLFFGPLSEMYGRVLILQIGNLFYLVFNLACGFAQTGPQMLVFRFLSGIGGSAPLAIGGGVLSDCWLATQRGRAISVYSLAPLIGPALGPIAGGFVTENTTWRWVFYATTIADGAIQVAGLFFLQETYTPKLLQDKAKRLRKETGNDKFHTEYDEPDLTLTKKLRTSIGRPFILLTTQPIIIVLASYMAYLYGITYLVLSTFPTLWTERYGESVGIGGLNYISLGVGFFVGSQTSAPFNDWNYRRMSKQNGGVGKPEYRVPVMVPGALLVPIGLFWYGWSAQAHTHWILPNIGAAIFSAGVIIGFQTIQTYIVDSYQRYAASGIAAATVLRSLAGFGFPLFAPAMYRALDYGWGNSTLGFIAIALGIPAPFLLWRYGEILRNKSQFAAG